MSRKIRPDRVWSAALLIGLTASAAHAAPHQTQAGSVRLQIAAKPVLDALIDFGFQADLSLGGDLGACVGAAPHLSGRMSAQAALDKILAHSGCEYVLADSRTVLIRKTVTPRARPPVIEAASPPLGLGEVVVTAQRYPNLPGRTPYAISVTSGAALRREGVANLSDLSGQVAGMTVTNLGPGRDKILLRGLSDGAFTGQTQSMVALYLDDVPITYSAPDPDLRLADIERVEIMRGPQGTLYGGGSLGGVVRIATRKPDLDRYQASVLAGLSLTQNGGHGDEAEVMANLPLIPGKVALRAVAYRDAQDGYISNTTLGLKRVNGSQRDGGRVSLRAALSSHWTATLGLTHQSINNADTQYGLRRLGSHQRDNRVREPHDNDFNHISLSVSGDGDWGRVTGTVSRLSHNFESRYDATTASALYGLSGAPAALDEVKSVDLTVGEITYATPTDRRVHGLVGAFASTGKLRLDGDLRALPSGLSVHVEDRTDNISEMAVYGEASLDLTRRLSITGGLRWFDFRFDTDSMIVQGADRRLFTDDNDAMGLSSKALVSYAADSGALFYAQVAEGYRPGGFNTAGRIGQAFDVAGAPPRQYKADELWNYEIGAKFKVLDGRLQGRVAAFYATWEAIQSDQYLVDGTAYTVNIGTGDNRGFEVEAAFRVTNRLDLRAAALLNDPQITRANSNFNARSDAGLPGVSRASASFGADYHHELAGDKTLRLQGQAAYVGSSNLTFDADKIHEMGEYLTLRSVVSLEAQAWTLTASIDNPLGDHANSFSFGNPFLISRDQVVTPPRPRTVALRLTARF
jgi:outer membrane receptor protein involved in Fe transport